MKILKILLFPFSFLYGCLTWLRNKLYDSHLISTTHFDIPIISVGNLSTGGTGKSPHIEYLIRLLKQEFKIATLSRGYGRNTNEFILADKNSTAEQIGDEPLQFKNKFPEIEVAVDAKRVNGVNQLLKLFPGLNVVLLDDAFQHRAVNAGLSILLTDYNNLYYDDFVLPTGNLREFRCGANRADIIIITKSPLVIKEEERAIIAQKINVKPHQRVYFSSIKYGNLVQVYPENSSDKSINGGEFLKKNASVILLTGIANPKPLEDYLKDKVKDIIPAKFADHHEFTEKDMMGILKIFNTIAPANKIIITTEKDWMRLKSHSGLKILKEIPVFCLPIEIGFSDADKESFNNQILEYVRGN